MLLACIGGTLPATALFETALGAKTLFFSFSTSDENLHAPNEFLRIARLREGMRAWEVLWRQLAAEGTYEYADHGEDEYRAYSYLPAGTLPEFELTPQFGRVPPYQGARLTGEQGQRSAAPLRDSLVISLHDHPVRFPADMGETPVYNRTGRQHAAYAGMRASGVNVMFDNLMDGTACVTGSAPWRWNDIITDLGMRLADLAHAPGFELVKTVADIDAAVAAGTVGLVFGLEAATPIENELDRLDVLYGLGIRQIGIAYSDANTLGSGLSEPVDGGLTAPPATGR